MSNVSIQKIKQLVFALEWQEKNLAKLQGFKEKLENGKLKTEIRSSDPLLKHIKDQDYHGVSYEYEDSKENGYHYFDLYFDPKDFISLLDSQIVKFHHKVLDTKETLDTLLNR